MPQVVPMQKVAMVVKIVISLCILLNLLELQTALAENEATVTTCSSVPIVEGMTGRIAFNLTNQMNATRDVFVINIKREEGHADVLRCERHKPNSTTVCDYPDSHFSSKGIEGNEIVLVAPNATTDLEGVYTLHVVVDGKLYPPTSCNLTVFEILKRESSNSSVAKVIVPVLIAFLVLFFVIIMICGVIHTGRKRRRSKTKNETKHPTELQKLEEPEDVAAIAMSDDAI
ncbi:uncharacterized protein [Littorina saxatilis]|uniref:Uncharacterized protein n=1 Tax=Littorina saxatilis TaxID=31220 RepID=A0AAN9BLF5_9CAEN